MQASHRELTLERLAGEEPSSSPHPRLPRFEYIGEESMIEENGIWLKVKGQSENWF